MKNLEFVTGESWEAEKGAVIQRAQVPTNLVKIPEVAVRLQTGHETGELSVQESTVTNT